VVASCGLLVLGGWFLDLPTLKSVLPGLATMKANTAVGFVLIGAGVVLLHRAARWPTYGCGLAAALLGTLHVAEYLLGKDLGIDELLVRESSASVLTVFPGRMSLTTAVAFVLTGSALCLLRSKHAAVRRLADVLAGATAVIGVLALSGYLYQAPALYHGASVSMAVHTAALFSLLALALLTAPPVRGIAAILISDDVGGVLARALLPAAVVAPVLIGWLRLAAQHRGLFGTEFGVAILTVANVLIFVSVILHAATKLGASELRRQRAARLLHESERGLGLFIENAHDYASFTLDPEGLVRSWNDGAQRLQGYTAEQIVGRHFSCFYMPEEVAARVPDAELVHALDAGLWAAEGWRLRHDGSRFWASVKIVPLKDQLGRLEGFSKLSQDISERRRSEEKLLEINASLDQQIIERTALLETARHGLAAALRETEALFSVVHQHAIVSVANPSGEITEVNDAFCRISGYERDELLGQDHRMINSGSQDRRFWLDMWRTISSGKPWRQEICNRAKDGSLYWVDTVIAPFFDGQGKIQKYVSVRFDVTAAKRADIALKAVTRQLTRAQRVSHVGSWELDVATGKITWSEELYRLMGLPPGGPIPDFAAQQALFTPEGWAQLTPAVVRAAATGESYELRLDVVRSDDGSLRATVARGEAILDTTGRVQHLAGTLQDVTEHERAADELRRVSERLWLATSAANMGVWDWNLLDNVLVWDETMHRLYNTSPDRFVGLYEGWRAALHPEDAEAAQAALGAAVNGSGDFNTSFRIVRPDGATRHLRAVAAVDRHPVTGRALRVVGVNWDITEQRAAEIALVEVNRMLVERSTQAEAANTAKSMFLANMSHEIRTPLNAVIGLTYLLEQSQLDAGQAGLVGKVKLASRSLLGVINNVLDLTKIEAGKTEVEESAFHLRALVEELISVMQVHAGAKGIELVLEPDDDLPPVLRGDGMHLRQILTNLLSNAIKFTPHGRVTLSVSVPERAEDRVTVRFAVKDSGIGIEPTVQGRLFTPFTQADSSTTRRFGGTGLGLSIVKRLVTLMDGTVAVTSTAGVGSDFVVELPFGVEQEVASDPVRPLEVLVAGDDAGFCAQLSSMARALGWKTACIEAGAQALERCLRQRMVAGDPVEVLILALGTSDIPDAQEILAVQAIASELRPAIVIASAGPGRSYDEAIPRWSVATTVLRGAATTSSVFNAVQEAVAARASIESSSLPKRVQTEVRAAGRPRPATDGPLRGKRLLVVDDSDINLEIATRILELNGARVTSATNGQEAVDLLRTRPSAFDAVLMDVQMPLLDGIKATRYIRSVLGLSSLPIIALTAGALLSERQRATDAGMNDFISKPFDPRAMIRKVFQHLSRRPGTDAPPPPPSADRPPDPPLDWPVIDGMDATLAFTCLGGDVALLTRVLRELLDEFADLSMPVGRADQVQGAALLAARLHKLTGTAGTLGATELAAAARAWEHALRSEAHEGVDELSRVLAGALTRLRASAAPLLAASSQRVTPAVNDTLEEIAPAATAATLDLDELIALLDRQSFKALHAFAVLGPALQDRMSDEAFAALDRALNAFQYDEARQMLQAVPGTSNVALPGGRVAAPPS
jgi:PAS domain S-box-containing protein